MSEELLTPESASPSPDPTRDRELEAIALAAGLLGAICVGLVLTAIWALGWWPA